MLTLDSKAPPVSESNGLEIPFCCQYFVSRRSKGWDFVLLYRYFVLASAEKRRCPWRTEDFVCDMTLSRVVFCVLSIGLSLDTVTTVVGL